MPGILLIEPVHTLAHLLERALKVGGYSEHVLASSYEDGLWYLQEAEMAAEGYDAIVLGVPGHEEGDFAAIMDKLAGGPLQQVPVLLMAHKSEERLQNWSRQRGHTAQLSWAHFGRIPARLAKLIPAETSSVPSGTEGMRLLFVDDSQSVRFAYRQLLETQGYQVDVAASLEEARKRLEAADNGGYELVICDYFLPDGTGDQLCRELVEQDPPQRVAIITGTYRESVIKACLDAGALECLFKNEAKELFVSRINALARAIEAQGREAQQREYLQGILASVADGVYGVDAEGRVKFINPAACAMLQFSHAEQVIGQPALDLFHYADASGQRVPPAESALQQAYVQGEALTQVEMVFQTAENRNLVVECSVKPMIIGGQRQGSVVVFRDISQRKQAEQLQWEVNHDALTGLPNRRYFQQQLEERLEGLRQQKQHGALLYLDIDRFRHLRDLLGTEGSRELLSRVAEQLNARMREGDLVCRLEGDIFTIYLHGIAMDRLLVQAEDFRELVRRVDYPVGSKRRSLTASIGVSILSDETPSAIMALDQARQACEEAKKKGRNQTHLFIDRKDHDTRAAVDQGWKQRFEQALRKNQFMLMAQPIVNLDVLNMENLKAIAGQVWKLRPAGGRTPEFIFELLLRMKDSRGQWISPAVFVPLAERVGMAQEIDLWVVKRAVRNLEVLGETRYPLSFTINLSNHTLQDPEMMATLGGVIASSRIQPERIIFEITETAAIEHLSAARKSILAMRKIGCQFALDDFGTGFSSFAHLKHLPVDFLKVDGMFVETMMESETDRAMVESINAMAHALGLKTIAEHVDSVEGVHMARSLGTDYVQGHFIGEPMPLNRINFQAFRKRPA